MSDAHYGDTMQNRSEQIRSHLRIKDVSHRYGPVVALNGVSFELGKSETLALIGPSGSGKSTLLAVIAGIVKPMSGQILLDGGDITRLPPEARGLGMVFQDYALWPHLTVFQNVAFPLHAKGIRSTNIAARVDQALQRVGLQGFGHRRPGELSGGQQQRVALARAIVAEPRLLLLDEPLSALDPATRSTVREELAGLLKRLRLPTLLVTHDRQEAFELADFAAVIMDGKIQQIARPAELYERPANLSVAQFMGVNVLSATVLDNGSARLDGRPEVLHLSEAAAAGPARLAIPPERTWIVDPDGKGSNVLSAKVLQSRYLGGEYRVFLNLAPPGRAPQLMTARSKREAKGDSVLVYLSPDSLHVVPGSPPTAPKLCHHSGLSEQTCAARRRFDEAVFPNIPGYPDPL